MFEEVANEVIEDVFKEFVDEVFGVCMITGLKIAESVDATIVGDAVEDAVEDTVGMLTRIDETIGRGNASCS